MSGSEPKKSQELVEIPMKSAKSLDGIISYLTKKHGGNVQQRGIVVITAKSIWQNNARWNPQNVADLTSDSPFQSAEGLDQWIRRDFGAMRVRLTHYTIDADGLKSWVVEGWLGGSNWTEIDQPLDNQDFKRRNKASFVVSNPQEFSSIRLTQAGTNHLKRGWLQLYGVEFFGTLFE
jgi:hypothetical protein